MRMPEALLPSFRKCELDKTWREHLMDIVYMSLFSLITLFGFCDSCRYNFDHFLIGGILNATIWVSQWKGHSFIYEAIDKRYSWQKHTVTRIILAILQLIFYSIISISIVYFLTESIFDITTGFFTRSGFITNILIAIAIGTFITLVSTSSQFFKNWKQSMLDAEKLKTAHIASQFETLKNQVNPHFLFNSLNVLTNLVYENQDTAAKFIKQLSVVYRYVLESRDKNVIELSEEIDFIDSYLYLQEMRFGNSLQAHVNIPEEYMNHTIPPLSIQMLLENAIKHNIASKASPLKIDIVIEQGLLIVRNNLQRKNILKEHSSGIGLNNIRERYKFLAGQDIVLSESAEQFEVRLPLINPNLDKE